MHRKRSGKWRGQPAFRSLLQVDMTSTTEKEWFRRSQAPRQQGRPLYKTASLLHLPPRRMGGCRSTCWGVHTLGASEVLPQKWSLDHGGDLMSSTRSPDGRVVKAAADTPDAAIAGIGSAAAQLARGAAAKDLLLMMNSDFGDF